MTASCDAEQVGALPNPGQRDSYVGSMSLVISASLIITWLIETADAEEDPPSSIVPPS